MKKILFFASAAALTLASCSDELDVPGVASNEVTGNTTLVATYDLGSDAETRTTISNGSTYSWALGDAIGVFNTDGINDVNALFGWTGSVFTGDLQSLTGSKYYAQYPYNPASELDYKDHTEGNKTVVDYAKLTVRFLPVQNFNHQAVPETWTWDYATGSFANGAAPSVAVATRTKENTLEASMLGVGSYIVFPIFGYTTSPVQYATLKVKNADGSYATLNGNFTVDMNQLSADSDAADVAEAFADPSNVVENTPTEGTEQAYNVDEGNPEPTSIKLNFGGSGLTLDPVTPTNIWFVVPPTVAYKGATFEVSFEDANGNSLNSISKEFDAEEYPTIDEQVGCNNVKWIVNNAKNTPWPVVSDNTFLASNALQFLEYASLVTYYANTDGYKTLPLWKELTAKQKKASSLADMLNVDPASASSISASNIKNLVLTTDIDLSSAAIEAAMKTAGLGSDMPQYFYYLSYYLSGSMTAIGSDVPFSIAGVGNGSRQIKNLSLVGSGLFTNNGSKAASVSNLTFTDASVNGSYLLASSQDVVAFNNVTVASVGSSNKAGYLFNAVTTKQMTAGVVNKTGLAMAKECTVNSNYDFTKNTVDPTKFTKYTIAGGLTAAPLLKVANKTAAQYVISKVAASNTNPWSIYDSSTSYWTGTSYAQTGNTLYAENLAYNNGQRKNTSLTMDIDCSGDLGKTWSLVTGTDGIGVNGNYYSINNVLIDATTNTSANDVSLFGNTATVVDLTINNLTIKNVKNGNKNANNDALIAALATNAGKKVTIAYKTFVTDNVTVNGMTVNTVDKVAATGGLFATVEPTSDFKNVTNIGSDIAVEETVTGANFGYVGGTINYTVDPKKNGQEINTLEITNPYSDFGADTFGNVVLTIGSRTEGQMDVTLKNFNLADAGKNGLAGLTLEAVDNSNNMTVNVTNGSGKTYQYYYNGTGYSFVRSF